MGKATWTQLILRLRANLRTVAHTWGGLAMATSSCSIRLGRKPMLLLPRRLHAPLPDSSVAIPTLDDAPVLKGIAGGGGVGWAKVGFPTCFNNVYLLILLVCGMENPRSQKKRKTKKRPKMRPTHTKRSAPHRSFGPCKWIGRRRFNVKFKIYRLRGQLKRRRLLHTIMLARSRRPVQNMTRHHAISSITWFSQVVRWVCGWLGFRVGELVPKEKLSRKLTSMMTLILRRPY